MRIHNRSIIKEEEKWGKAASSFFFPHKPVLLTIFHIAAGRYDLLASFDFHDGLGTLVPKMILTHKFSQVMCTGPYIFT